LGPILLLGRPRNPARRYLPAAANITNGFSVVAFVFPCPVTVGHSIPACPRRLLRRRRSHFTPTGMLTLFAQECKSQAIGLHRRYELSIWVDVAGVEPASASGSQRFLHA